jgi:hypothetical protein
MFTSLLGKSNPFVPLTDDGAILPEPPFDVLGITNNLAIDLRYNAYTNTTSPKSIYKLNGITSEVVDTIGYPTGYTSNWSIRNLTWNAVTDRLVVLMYYSGADPNHHWIELVGFSQTVAVAIPLEENTSGVSFNACAAAFYDPNLNRIIGFCTAYDGQYHHYIHHWDLSGDSIGWYGRCNLAGNGGQDAFGVFGNTRMYTPYADTDQADRVIAEFDYYNYPGTGYTPVKSTITGMSRYEITGYGAMITPAGDMWLMGRQTGSPYLNILKGYVGISDTRQGA